MTTRPAKNRNQSSVVRNQKRLRPRFLIDEASYLFAIEHQARDRTTDHSLLMLGTSIENESVQANRAISTGKLNALPRLHTRPINVVVYHGSSRENSFRGGFPA